MEEKKKIRGELIASGILDAIGSLALLAVSFIMFMVFFVLLIGGMEGLTQAEKLVVGPLLAMVYPLFLFFFLIYFALFLLTLILGIKTLAVSLKTPSAFAAKKGRVAGSLVAVCFALVSLIAFTVLVYEAVSWLAFFFAVLTASVVLKIIALCRYKTVPQTAACVKMDFSNSPESAFAKYSGLKELAASRKKGFISNEEYERKRMEIIEAEDIKRTELSRIMTLRSGGKITAEEYESERRKISDPEGPAYSDNRSA